jgi:hypothetical protein
MREMTAVPDVEMDISVERKPRRAFVEIPLMDERFSFGLVPYIGQCTDKI